MSVFTHVESYLGVALTQVDEINPLTTIHFVYPTQPIPMAADALATLGASASAAMILTPKAGIFHLQHQMN